MRLASAEDRVAETIPAIIIGPNADASCITWRMKNIIENY